MINTCLHSYHGSCGDLSVHQHLGPGEGSSLGGDLTLQVVFTLHAYPQTNVTSEMLTSVMLLQCSEHKIWSHLQLQSLLGHGTANQSVRP